MTLPSPRTFTPHDLATLTAAQVEALPPADRRAFFIASAKATDPFYPHHLEHGSFDGLTARQPIEGDYDRIGSNRRFELGE